MTDAPTIRLETASDKEAVFRVNRAAFPDEDVASLVDELRANGNLALSLVAEVDGEVVGHVGFSPVTFDYIFRRCEPGSCRRSRCSLLVSAGGSAGRCARGAITLQGAGRGRLCSCWGTRNTTLGIELREGALDGVDSRLVLSPEFARFE